MRIRRKRKRRMRRRSGGRRGGAIFLLALITVVDEPLSFWTDALMTSCIRLRSV